MKTNIKGMVFKNKDFRNEDLSGLNFEFTKLVNCNFSGADLTDAYFNKCNIKNCNFTDTRMKNVTFNKCALASSLFFNVLVNTSFMDCTIVNTKFCKMMVSCKFHSTNVKHSSFARLGMSATAFTDSHIEDVDFSRVKLSGVTGLEHTIFTETGSSGVNIEVLYISATDTVYLNTHRDCISMPLSEFADYIESWYTADTLRGLDSIINLERLEIIENYLQMTSNKTI